MTDTSFLRLSMVGIGSAFLLAACGVGPAASPTPTSSPAPSIAPSPSPTPAPSPSPSPSPVANVAVVRIEQIGGMLPPWETLRSYPFVVLYADGRLITQGPQIAIYPGPALPNLQVTQLTQQGVQQVLQWAAEAGLQGPDRMLGEPILDGGVTVFTVVRADGTHRTSVADVFGDDPAVGALRQFQDLMLNLRTFLGDDVVGDDTPYAWDRLRIVSFPVDPTNVTDPQFVTTLDWPLDPLATLGQPLSEPDQYRCALIEGEDVETLRPLLQQANDLTLWRSGNAEYQLYLHPLLPDDEPCPV